MSERAVSAGELAETIGYCGLVCGLCTHSFHGCVGCKHGGGDEDCHQEACCVESELAGCWACERFPCGEGYFVDPAWRGLCIACVQAIREQGLETFTRRLRARCGEEIDYGAYRLKAPQAIRQMLFQDGDT